MPTVTETPIDGYAHCTQPRCRGNQQEPVKALRVDTSTTYVELGGDMPGVERSHVQFRFADPELIKCPFCGTDREVTDQARISYAPLSGHDPLGLLDVRPFDPRLQREIVQEAREQGVDPEKEQLREQNEYLQGVLARLEDQIEKLTDAKGS